MAFSQLGGMLRNAEPYWTVEVTGGSHYAKFSAAPDLRVAWGNDFEDSKWEIGVAVLTDKNGAGGNVYTVDLTYFNHYDLGEVFLDFGLGLELHTWDYSVTNGLSGGLVSTVILSVPDFSDVWDPYVLARFRKHSWDIGAGVRYRF